MSKANHHDLRKGRPRSQRISTEVLRRVCADARLGRSELAQRLGVTSRTLQRAENEGLVSPGLLDRLCEVLRVPVVALLEPELATSASSIRDYGLAPGRAPLHVGRERELAALRHHFERRGRSVVVLAGPVGIGTTTIARAFAAEAAERFPDGVVWVAASAGDSRLVQRDIARALGFERYIPVGEGSGRDWRQAFVSHFWRGERLLVLDGITETERILDFVADAPSVAVLATTSFAHIGDGHDMSLVRVAPLEDGPIASLLGIDDKPEVTPEVRADLLRLVGGLPGIAAQIGATLRRERLTTAASWLVRLESGPDEATGDPAAAIVRSHYTRLRPHVSDAAWLMFAALSVFDTEPFPLGWAAAASATSRERAASLASELLDVFLIELDDPGDAERDPWLRLSPLASLGGRVELGADAELVRERVAQHALTSLWGERQRSRPALASLYKRHQGLLRLLRRDLDGPEPTSDLAAIADPRDVPAWPAGSSADMACTPARARVVIDLVIALAPLILVRTVGDAERWLDVALRAARRSDDPHRRGLVHLFFGLWRGFCLGLSPLAFHDAAREGFATAGDGLGQAAATALLGQFPVIAGRDADARHAIDEARAGLRRSSVGGTEAANLLQAMAQVAFMVSAGPSPHAEAAALCDEAEAELARDAAPDPWCAALIRLDRATYRCAAGGGSPLELEGAVTDLIALQPEPWLRAGLMAHAARFGAALGHGSSAAALDAARHLLWEATRTCSAADAPQLLWFVNSCTFYELMRRRNPVEPYRMIRGGIARHGLPRHGPSRIVPELCAVDRLVMLSIEATGALLDERYLDLAISLSECLLAGRQITPTLRGLRASFSGEG